MDDQDNSTNYVLTLAIGIGLMAACGVTGFVTLLLAILVF